MVHELLPDVDKRVIYLDQNAFSILFKVQSKGRLPKGHEDSCLALYEKVRRVVLLQQAVFPHSDIHQAETIVFGQAAALREAYEGIGGDIAFKDADDVDLMQTLAFAEAYAEGRDPVLSFDVDGVLKGRRNEWLPDMRITVNTNYEQFAPAIRGNRHRTHAAMMELVGGWAERKPTFEDVLEHELSVIGRTKTEAQARALAKFVEAQQTGDLDALLNAAAGSISRERMALSRLFGHYGVADEDHLQQVIRFWHWERNREQPSYFIFANLIAAIARRVSLGQRSFSQGLMNDIRAISVYGPYVDAMFVDKEFAILLRETPQLRTLPLKARIFSFANPDDFITYLDGLEAAASDEIRAYAERIYGIGG